MHREKKREACNANNFNLYSHKNNSDCTLRERSSSKASAERSGNNICIVTSVISFFNPCSIFLGVWKESTSSAEEMLSLYS